MDILTKEILYKKTSQELTALLYEALLDHLEAAKLLIIKNQFLKANEKLQRCNDILQRLGVGLKYEAGPIAEQLDGIYNYLAKQIILANRKKDYVLIEEVLQVLVPIVQAWNKAMKMNHAAPSESARKLSTYESQIMRQTNS
ncbi:flagellar export chaperone FliS [Peribacillus sp. FSL H8-0477]|uniref:flagellar export chaperone FliS n=1 Tax=Peribacillus sp. FSL H8-0477 TaxID=2921388 RepID=UPI0030F7AF91